METFQGRIKSATYQYLRRFLFWATGGALLVLLGSNPASDQGQHFARALGEIIGSATTWKIFSTLAIEGLILAFFAFDTSVHFALGSGFQRFFAWFYRIIQIPTQDLFAAALDLGALIFGIFLVWFSSLAIQDNHWAGYIVGAIRLTTLLGVLVLLSLGSVLITFLPDIPPHRNFRSWTWFPARLILYLVFLITTPIYLWK